MLRLQNVSRTYPVGDDEVVALDDVSLEIADGDFVAIVGPSGSGKSTLLNLIGSLDRPDQGTITVDGSPLLAGDASAYRAGTVGFVFQFHNLIPVLSAAENVQVPMFGRGASRGEREARAESLLREVGLAERAKAFPPTLSGGERQRAAIARALANDPRLLLADEPTGALDSESGRQIVSLLQHLREARGMTILLVTNDHDVAAQADRVVELRDGRLLAA